jgi:hypothetical protein
MPPTTDPAIMPPMGVDDPDEVGLGVGGKAVVEVTYILDEGLRRRRHRKVCGGNGCCLKGRRRGRRSSTRRGRTIWNRSLWDMIPTITLATGPSHTRLDWRFDPTIVSLVLLPPGYQSNRFTRGKTCDSHLWKCEGYKNSPIVAKCHSSSALSGKLCPADQPSIVHRDRLRGRCTTCDCSAQSPRIRRRSSQIQ